MNLLPAHADARPGWARVGTVLLRHRGGDAALAGTPLTLAIRPEEVVIGAAARHADNAVTARVRTLQFLGAFTRLVLALPGDEAVLECDIAAGALADVAAKEGSELALALPPAALRAFRE
jgi:iron(III) transport system ATP-binding protein